MNYVHQRELAEGDYSTHLRINEVNKIVFH